MLIARKAEKLAIPAKADVEDMVEGQVIVRLNEAWTTAGHAFAASALVDLDLASVKADPAHPSASLVWTPGPRESLGDVAVTRERLLITTLDNVRGRTFVFTRAVNGGWSRARLDLPDNLDIDLGDTDRQSNQAFLGVSGFLTPNALWLTDAGAGSVALVKSLPAKFDARRDVVEQHEAVSSDGVAIPYFVVHRRASSSTARPRP